MKKSSIISAADIKKIIRNKACHWGLFILAFCLSSTLAQAKVEGPCSNCHTMHNSQDGAPMITSGTGTTLLIADCVGCHSSTTDQTIVNRTPIVYNTVPPAKPLAGGNFYWVAQGGDANDVFGHNVWGISEPDGNIDASVGAPGSDGFTCGTNSCHQGLASNPASNFEGKNGCQGCHYEVAHHDDSKPWFRFLKGHIRNDAYVTGIEAADWEQNATTDPTDRNTYRGTDPATLDYSWGNGLSDTHTTSAFCSGCHDNFHTDMGISSPWIRHPNDILLPTTAEYGTYDPINNYSNEAPVAYIDPANPLRAEAVVTCLSCHRAHGSDQPDMLRWDYVNMPAGTGCYTCHTEKDD